MDKDILILMKFLSKKSFITLADLENSLEMTRRQAKYRIQKLNDLLKEEEVPPILVSSSATKDIVVSDDTKKVIKSLLKDIDQNDVYYLSKKERLIYMYLMLFINKAHLTLNDFIDSLQVSRSTVLLDLKELTQTLEELNIHIKNDRKRGYYLVGSEMEIRRFMMKNVIYTLADEDNNKVFDIFINDFYLDDFNYSKIYISNLAKKHKIRFVENRLIEFIYIFIFLNTRMQNEKYSSDEIVGLMDIDAMSYMKEYKFSYELLKKYNTTENITKADVNYIAAWILGISFGDINEDTKDCVLISDLIGKMMTRFESLSGVHYKNTEEIFIQLYSHFRPAYYRLLFKLPIFNPVCDKVKEEYPELYQLVEQTMKPFNIIFGEEIPAGEIAYLTMHFSTIYSGKKGINIEKQKTALVVCSNGIGSSAILYNELASMFPELHFLSPIDSSKLSDFSEKVDIIFATNYLENIPNINIPIIHVSPVMSIAERYQVMREVYMQLGSGFLKKTNVDVVMDIISKHADIQNRDALYNELINYFSEIDNISNKDKENELHLLDMVRENIIRLNIEAENWEEAVRLSYEPLLENGFITQKYIDETVRIMNSVGPYVVITKHTALLHTKPESGALSCAMGIGVLKNPINFGSAEHDPIKYVFSLSAIDNHTHLCAMAELLELFNDDKFFMFLDTANDSEEVIEYIKSNININ
ncbi:transcription antiterminator [Peptacetobacter hiranonis]|uniref:BglG family transcription antiterminator n=1 Tax=Peptacetobacter hiranonis TaxID=89152 RepID=UPI001916F161|nr:BglG family transcription antiterminator [Peptacetobacter hiranonis]QQQ86900.1 transcription antiterminator [Peptacetobacter hiranonis]